MTKRGGLGRGLAALIPTSAPPAEQPAAAPPPAASPSAAAPPFSLVPSPPDEEATPATGSPAPVVLTGTETVGVPGAQLLEVAVEDIVPNPKQPRQVFDDEALEELTHSVREFG